MLTARQPTGRRFPSILVVVYWLRLTGRLVWIWQELRAIPAALALTGAAFALGGRWWDAVYICVAVGTFDLLRSWARGDFTKNVGDTYAAIVACDWRIARLSIPIWPKLVSVGVQNPYSIPAACRHRKRDGAWGLPAAACRLEFRPHATDPVSDVWAEALEHWATNRYGFSQHTPLTTARRSRNVLVLDMGDPIIPDAVTAGQWHD
jgi:hypothetical protein